MSQHFSLLGKCTEYKNNIEIRTVVTVGGRGGDNLVCGPRVRCREGSEVTFTPGHGGPGD